VFPTKFRFIWLLSFRGEDALEINKPETISMQTNNKNLHIFASTQKEHTLINMNDNINMDSTIPVAASVIARREVSWSLECVFV
jgi:hypothetical protein